MPAKVRVGWPSPAVARINTLRRPLGLEVELSVWKTLREWQPKGWSYTTASDASVTPSGLELVTSPLAGDLFLKATAELGTEITQHDSQVNNTCGLHVHVDGSDLSYWQLRRLLRMYVTYERQIFEQLAGPQRLGNMFCRLFELERKAAVRVMGSAKSTRELKAQLYEMLYNLAPPKASEELQGTTMYKQWAAELMRQKAAKYGGGEFGHDSRYMGLNLHSWLHRGTVEWRQHEGTTSTEELMCWPLWCGWFVELAANLSDAAVEKLSPNLQEMTTAKMPGFLGKWAARRSAALAEREAA